MLHDILSKNLTGSHADRLLGFASWLSEAKGVAAPRSGWSSCSAVRTGRLKRSPAVHARPIDLVVFQEPSHLLLETSSWRGLRA